MATTNSIPDNIKAFVYYKQEINSNALIYWLENFSINSKLSKKDLIELYNVLLFSAAHPFNISIYRASIKAIEKLNMAFKTFSEEYKSRFINTGLPYTEIQGTFSLLLTNWLVKQFDKDIQIHSFDKAGKHPKEILKSQLNNLEFELMGQDNISVEDWVMNASGKENSTEQLIWLLNNFKSLKTEEQLKEYLFESVILYLNIKPSTTEISKAGNKLPFAKTFFHSDGIIKKFDYKKLIKKALPKRKSLSVQEKTAIQRTSRIALLLLNRETDPITFNNVNDIHYYELERGLSIALFSMLPKNRLAIESYIGFMMYKNGYPMAYGGAWLFGKRSLIGVNIFESFRGGESSYVFSQLLRTYHKAFGATYFEVEPYQFGKGNPEGIKSGAFWFYHRFGFRPIDEKLNKIAEKEYQRIVSEPGYRTPEKTLKEFTKSNLSVNLVGTNSSSFSPNTISNYISDKINSEFNGNRNKALKSAASYIKKKLNIKLNENSLVRNQGFKKLGLLYFFCIDINLLPNEKQKILIELIHSKDKNEFNYINALHTISFKKILHQDFINYSKEIS
ncbi:MAG: hypothetical protein AB7O73_01455 [Bacteroidia bacterium]